MMDYVKLKGLDVKSVVVVRDGYIVFEQYAVGQGPHEPGRGLLGDQKLRIHPRWHRAAQRASCTDLDAKILDLLPGAYENVDDRKQAMTLEDVLTMRTGLTWTDDDATLDGVLLVKRPDEVHARPSDGGGAGHRLQLLLGVLAPADHARVVR